jgi:hypothetical protein
MRGRLIATAAATVFLAGCGSVPATSVDDQVAALNAKQLCCEDLKGIDYELLEVKIPRAAVLDSNGPARQFFQERSYFKAFAIPPGEAQGIWIKSYFNGLFIKQFLQPLVLFLDADHNPLGIVEPFTRFRQPRMFGGRVHMEGGVSVPPNAKYAIVFTRKFADAPGFALTAPSTGAFLIGNTAVVTTSPGKYIALERSMTGELSLELEDLSKLPLSLESRKDLSKSR